MNPKTTLLLAVLIGASTAAHSADLWRMYRCVGDHGEAVFSDRKTGTDCVEIWLSPQPRDGWTITDPSVNEAKEQPQ